MKKCPVCGMKSESDVVCPSCGIPMIDLSDEGSFFETDNKNSIVNECESGITTEEGDEKVELKKNIVITIIVILLLAGVLGSGLLMKLAGLVGIAMMVLQLKGIIDLKSYIPL